jgi:dTMP kinase
MPTENDISSMSKLYPGTFITLEGPEGAGKTTQLKLIAKKLAAINCQHVITRAPGGTALGKQIRRILLNPENPVQPLAELLLFQADLAQNIEEVIRPALKAGLVVFCDRYIDSTLAYQAYGRGLSFELIASLNKVSTGELIPELTILFDLESEEGLGRRHPGSHDRLEQEALEFHQRVRHGYLDLARQDPERFRVLDAAKPLTVVQEEFSQLVGEKLSLGLA